MFKTDLSPFARGPFGLLIRLRRALDLRRRMRFLLLALALSAGFPLFFGTPKAFAEKETTAGKARVAVIPIEGPIVYTKNVLIRRAINRALKYEPDYIIYEINTPGGLVDITLEICSAINDIAPDIPSVAYITYHAWSAGAAISLACDKIYIAPRGSIGSAMPITISPEGGAEAVGEKFNSAFRAEFRALAEDKGRNPYVAEAMVDMEMEVIEIQIAGKEESEIIDRIGADDLGRQGVSFAELKTICPKGELLNLSAKQAIEIGFLDGIATDRKELFGKLGLDENPELMVFSHTWSEWLSNFLETSPILMALLLIVGILGLYVEFKVPGFGLPGIVGVTCLAIVFFGKYVAGLATAIELILIIAGIVLILIEVFVIPGVGITGIVGLFALLLGTALAFQDFTIPQTDIQYGLFYGNIKLFTASLLVVVIAAVLLAKFLPGIPILNRIMLAKPVPRTTALKTAEEKNNYMDAVGKVVATLKPGGRVKIGEEILEAVSEGPVIENGVSVRVVSVDSMKLIVRKA